MLVYLLFFKSLSVLIYHIAWKENKLRPFKENFVCCNVHLWYSELVPCIKEMVDSLTNDYRQALILTEYEGLTQRELAVRLGISVSGAKSRVQRAREKLKDMLLDCCHFEFDHSGRVIDYQPKC